jgi:hypothetical protein
MATTRIRPHPCLDMIGESKELGGGIFVNTRRRIEWDGKNSRAPVFMIWFLSLRYPRCVTHNAHCIFFFLELGRHRRCYSRATDMIPASAG